MTDKELIKALRCCTSRPDCDKCAEECVFYRGNNVEGCVPDMGVTVSNRLEALLAENEHLREVTKMVPKWVSAKERLPKLTNKENEQIEHFGVAFAPEFIVLIKGADATTTLKFDGEEWLDDDGTRYRVAYWCRLPEPPSTEGVE